MFPWRIGHVDSERNFSGGEVQVFLLMEGLRKFGHEVVLFCRAGSRCAMEAERRGIEYVPVPMTNDLDWRGFTALARAFRAQQLDLVHLHTGRANWLGGLAAWRSSVPAVSTRRMERQVRRNWHNRTVYTRFLRRVVSISPAVSECLRAGGVDPARIVLIPEAVDPKRLLTARPRAETRAELGAGEGERVVLTAAALVRRKGIDVLLHAVAQLEGCPKPHVWIAGDGPERKPLAALAEQLGLRSNVRFLGKRDDTADLLPACDIFVLPSRQEGLGVAALEAMAAAKPVICSKVGGLMFSVVDERTGLHVSPGDSIALSQALARLLHDDVLRHRLGNEGPKRIEERFTPERMIAAHLRLYAEVLAG